MLCHVILHLSIQIHVFRNFWGPSFLDKNEKFNGEQNKESISTIYKIRRGVKFTQYKILASVADPGFLERGFICIKVLGVHFADFMSFFLNIP